MITAVFLGQVDKLVEVQRIFFASIGRFMVIPLECIKGKGSFLQPLSLHFIPYTSGWLLVHHLIPALLNRGRRIGRSDFPQYVESTSGDSVSTPDLPEPSNKERKLGDASAHL